MKELPILFSAPMVKAILAGNKTQTRRLVNPQPSDSFMPIVGPYYRTIAGSDGELFPESFARWGASDERDDYPCKHGQPGDQLWVREEHYRLGHWEPIHGVLTRKCRRQKWRFSANSPEVRYNDNAPEAFRKGMHKETPDFIFWHKRLARFMPRSFSRITLEITAVRMERLNDITEEEAVAEGAIPIKTRGELQSDGTLKPLTLSARFVYRDIWTRINGAGSWASNPWVWVIEFRRVHK